jgi:hypothetical protein
VQDSRIHPSSVALADGRPPEFRRVVSFHPRGGRLNDVQRRAFDAHADRWYHETAHFDGPLDAAARARWCMVCATPGL